MPNSSARIGSSSGGLAIRGVSFYRDSWRRGDRGLLELPEPAHTRALQSLAGLQETRAARRGHLVVRLHEARHREIDPPER